MQTPVCNEDQRCEEKKTIALYASPKCCEAPNLRRYKSYFNVAWFVRAYSNLLSSYHVVTTDETKKAVDDARSELDAVLESEGPANKKAENEDYWGTPNEHGINLVSVGSGHEAQVELAARAAEGQIDRLLMFQDPDDVFEHLPEAYALIRNCTLANVGLNINAGATFWAESQNAKSKGNGYGKWRTKRKGRNKFRGRINPRRQTIAFIAHDSEKARMSNLIYHYRNELRSNGYKLTGTSGTIKHALQHLVDKDTPPWQQLELNAAGAVPGSGHGPTGGDVVIAAEIIKEWKTDYRKQAEFGLDSRNAYKAKPAVRSNKLSHVVVFFIDHRHAQPHQADIHVLLRTCLHPSIGVHLLLNERSAQEWLEVLRLGALSKEKK